MSRNQTADLFPFRSVRFRVKFRVNGDWDQDQRFRGDLGGNGRARFLSPLIPFSAKLISVLLRLMRKLFVTGS